MNFRRAAVPITAWIIFSATICSGAAEPTLSIVPRGEKYFYRLNETAVLDIRAVAPDGIQGAPTVHHRLHQDEAVVLAEGDIDLSEGKASLEGSLDFPGFLRCDIYWVAGADTLRAACGVGYDVRAIRPTGLLPEDFKRFWRQARSELVRIPVDARLEEVAVVDPGDVRRFKVSLAHCDGGRVYGWLHLPKGEGPFPTILSIPGSGIGRTGRYAQFTEGGFAILAMEIHGLEPHKENIRGVRWIEQDSVFAYLGELETGILAGYHNIGKEDPYHYYHRRSLQAAMRALDYLVTRKDVDGSRICAFGGSQGGGLSLLLASMDKRVKAVIATVPGFCDQAAFLYGRAAELGLFADGDRDRIKRTLSYYDAALAAELIEVPTLIGVGFIDDTCNPTKVYAAYNNLRGPKKIDNFLHTGHGSAPGWRERSIAWLQGVFGMSQ
ncbi:acetylxylan esterase [candidate division KSB1 bacterium]